MEEVFKKIRISLLLEVLDKGNVISVTKKIKGL